MRHLKGKRALVTGAAGGIGRAIALRLAEKGVHLALADIEPFGLARTKREAEALGVEATDYVCDVAEPERVTRVTESLLDRWGGVDVLVNNAGVTYHGRTHWMPAEDWDRMLDVNLRSHVQFTRELLRSLTVRPEAHVLNVCSTLGLCGMARVTAYCTTKFAMIGFSESLRAEYNNKGLGVTALCPGLVKTGLFAAGTTEEGRESTKAPPDWLCVSAERVARRAVRAIERNERRVVIDPVGRFLQGPIRFFPGVFDRLRSLGRGRRIAEKRRELEALSRDPEAALKMRIEISRGNRSAERKAA